MAPTLRCGGAFGQFPTVAVSRGFRERRLRMQGIANSASLHGAPLSPRP